MYRTLCSAWNQLGRLGPAATAADSSYRAFTDASSSPAPSTGGASPTTTQVSRHETPGPATWWLVRTGAYPARSRAAADLLFRMLCWPSWQEDGWKSGIKGLWSAQWQCPCADPRAILEDRPLDGVGSFPAGHVPGVNEMFRQHVSRLSTCVCKPTSFALIIPHVSLHWGQ